MLLEELLPQPTVSTAVSKATLAPSANRRARKNQSTESLLSMVITLIVVFEFRGAVFATTLHVAARTSKRVGSSVQPFFLRRTPSNLNATCGTSIKAEYGARSIRKSLGPGIGDRLARGAGNATVACDTESDE